MKLSYFAFAMTFMLLGVTTWLAWNEHQQATGVRNKLEMYQRRDVAAVQQQGVPAAQVSQEDVMKKERELMSRQPSASVSSSPGVLAPTMIPPSSSLPDLASNSALPPPPPMTPFKSSATPVSVPNIPAPMTAWQKMVLSLPAISKVTEINKDLGFVVIGAGLDRKITTGQVFALRRGNGLVGQIKVSSVEEDSSVGDLDPKSVPAGVTIEPGDDVVQNVPPE